VPSVPIGQDGPAFILFRLSTGLRCEDEDACVRNPCRGGSLCETLPGNASYQCVCEMGWTGRDCDVDIDECQESTPLSYLLT